MATEPTAFQRLAAAPAAQASTPAQPVEQFKYTLLLDGTDYDHLDQLRRNVGRRASKSDVLRALIRLAAHDEQVQQQLTQQ